MCTCVRSDLQVASCNPPSVPSADRHRIIYGGSNHHSISLFYNVLYYCHPVQQKRTSVLSWNRNRAASQSRSRGLGLCRNANFIRREVWARPKDCRALWLREGPDERSKPRAVEHWPPSDISPRPFMTIKFLTGGLDVSTVDSARLYRPRLLQALRWPDASEALFLHNGKRQRSRNSWKQSRSDTSIRLPAKPLLPSRASRHSRLASHCCTPLHSTRALSLAIAEKCRFWQFARRRSGAPVDYSIPNSLLPDLSGIFVFREVASGSGAARRIHKGASQCKSSAIGGHGVPIPNRGAAPRCKPGIPLPAYHISLLASRLTAHPTTTQQTSKQTTNTEKSHYNQLHCRTPMQITPAIFPVLLLLLLLSLTPNPSLAIPAPAPAPAAASPTATLPFSPATRPGTRRADRLWPSATIVYEFERDLPARHKTQIKKGMAHIASKTCIRFRRRAGDKDRDYVLFSDNHSGCYSESLGRAGGRQLINLAPACHSRGETYGIVVHEILHALGMAHEQNRPDRARYVKILWNNIKKSAYAYYEQSHMEADSFATPYDYASIMHYAVYNSFGKPGKPTMKILRPFRREIGQRRHLSRGDVTRVCRMYNCPSAGLAGHLRVRVATGRHIRNLHYDPDGRTDACVEVVAVTAAGREVRRETRVRAGTEAPVWRETLDLGRARWQFFRVQVWDGVRGEGEGRAELTLAETFEVVPGRVVRKHCYAPERTWCDYGRVKIVQVFEKA